MKKWMKLGIMIAVLSVVIISGCKDDSDSDVPKFDILKDYLDDGGMTITELTDGWITTASAVVDSADYTIPDYYVMDIRSQADYDTLGHISGANHSSLDSIVVDAKEAQPDKPILVVCYTGQGAGHAVMALRLSGFPDAKVLKWGMSGCNEIFDSWTGNCAQLDNENWIAPTGEIAENVVYEYPTIDTDSEDGAEILAERVDALLAGGFKGISAVNDTGDGVLDTPEAYFINNYWAAADVETYGNISGAHRINPLVLENLDPAGTVVTYCWTGQTSSMVTAYLTVLGYDAKSLIFGANSMIYDDLLEHKWEESADYEYDVTE